MLPRALLAPMRTPILLLLLVLGLPSVIAAEPAWETSGSFLVGGSGGSASNLDCGIPAWDGVLGSCFDVPTSLAGRLWTFEVHDAALAPGSVDVCAFGEGRSFCVFAGSGSRIDAPEGLELPAGVHTVRVSADGGADLRWRFTVH